MRLEPGYPISNSAPGRRGKLSCLALASKGAGKNAPTAKSSRAQDFMFMNCLSDRIPQCCGKIISAETAGQATKYGSASLRDSQGLLSRSRQLHRPDQRLGFVQAFFVFALRH